MVAKVEAFNPKYKLLTERQVAEWLGVNVSLLQRMRYTPPKDPIPFTKIGGSVRYREDHVIKWLERNTFDSIDQVQREKTGA
jgi:hypothetical protein